MRRSNFESMRSTVVLSVVMRESNVCFVVIDRLEAVEVELESSLVFFAFFVAAVAISEGGALFELNVDTESVSLRSFSMTSVRFPNVPSDGLEGSGDRSISLSMQVRSSNASSASVVTVLVCGSNFILLPLLTARGVKKALMLSSPYS